MIAPPLERPLLQGVLSMGEDFEFEIFSKNRKTDAGGDDKLWIQFAPPYEKWQTDSKKKFLQVRNSRKQWIPPSLSQSARVVIVANTIQLR